MRKNKGMTLITIVVTIIILVIIASVSILSGNKLIEETKEYRDEEVVQNVKQAILRRKSEIETQGSITPLGQVYVGQADPLVGKGDINAKGWHMLSVNELKEIGVHDVVGRYLVNYNYEEVITLEDPEYTEKYLICEYIHRVKELGDSNYEKYTTKTLLNKLTGDSAEIVYEDTKTGNVYGTKWYLVSKSTINSNNVLTDAEKNYITNDYLVNFQDDKYVKKTNSFVEK